MRYRSRERLDDFVVMLLAVFCEVLVTAGLILRDFAR